MYNLYNYKYNISPRAEAPAALHRFLGGSVGSSSVFLRLADAAPGVSGWSSEVCVRAGQYLCIYIYHFYYIYIIILYVWKKRETARERERKRKRKRDRDRDRERERVRDREREMSCIIYVYVPRTFASKYECRLVNGNHGNTIALISESSWAPCCSPIKGDRGPSTLQSPNLLGLDVGFHWAAAVGSWVARQQPEKTKSHPSAALRQEAFQPPDKFGA